MKQNFFSLKFFQVLFFSLFLVVASGCAPSADKAGGLKEVKDADGTMVAVQETPKRIVSLGLSVDDILIDIVPAERIAALTYLADDPGISNVAAKAKQVEKRVQANVESVLVLKPDLVIVPSWQSKDLVQALRNVGLTVYVCKTAQNMPEVKENIREIAAITDAREKGEQLIAQLDAELNAVLAKVNTIPENERLTVVQFSAMGAGNSFTLDEICRYAGVKNGAALAGVPYNQMLTKEQIIMINPDFCLLPTYAYASKTVDLNQYRKNLEEDPAYQNIKAVKNKRLYNIPDRYLFTTSH
ncbi:MAG: ABC transporter substrate-binding protein, partial [Sporomusaceae bacterium]|nr:ABC transporter substrate-binding protein [Sporomusaceae bacterium]